MNPQHPSYLPAGEQPGWTRLDKLVNGLPAWKRRTDPLIVATGDFDEFLFIAAALEQFDVMDPFEFMKFI